MTGLDEKNLTKQIDQSEKVYQNLISNAGCSSAQHKQTCLRSLSSEEFRRLASLTEISLPLQYWPVIDGNIIARAHLQQLKNEDLVRVPYLIGDNSDEGTAFSSFGVNTDDEIIVILSGLYTNQSTVNDILSLYLK